MVLRLSESGACACVNLMKDDENLVLVDGMLWPSSGGNRMSLNCGDGADSGW